MRHKCTKIVFVNVPNICSNRLDSSLRAAHEKTEAWSMAGKLPTNPALPFEKHSPLLQWIADSDWFLVKSAIFGICLTKLCALRRNSWEVISWRKC